VSRRPDESDQLASLLRALPSPEPSGDFLAGAQRRYRAALAGRARREALTALVAALIGVALIAALLGPVMEPATLVAWLAEAAADVARWTTGVGIVLALVPPVVWTSMAAGFAATVLSLVIVARTRSLATAK
jgi:hypothetical protein